MESATLPYGRGGSGRSTSVVGNGRSRELCEALELASTTLQADHLRFFTSNHSRPVAAAINTTMMLHGVDEVALPSVESLIWDALPAGLEAVD